MSRYENKRWRVLLTCVVAVVSGVVSAAGIEAPFVSIRALGSANANAAEAGDASVQYFNPAGMALLGPGRQLGQSFGVILGGGRVENDIGNSGGSRTVQSYGSSDGVEDGARITGPGSEFLPGALPIGSLFYAAPYDEHLTLGLGIFSPGGGNLNYKGDWFGRYFVKSAAMETVSFNPALAIRLNSRHSFGAGVSLIVGHSLLKQKVDLSSAAPYLTASILSDYSLGDFAGLRRALAPLGILDPVLNIEAGGIIGLLPNGVRGLIYDTLGRVMLDPESTAAAEAEMFGIGFGFNVGYFFQISEDQRIGLSFRSRSDVRLRGDLKWDLSDVRTRTSQLDPVLFSGLSFSEYLVRNYRPDTEAALDLIIPAKWDLAYFVSVSPRVDFMANLQFNQTSVVGRQCLRFSDQAGERGSVSQGDQCLDLRWRDSFTASLGMNYHLGEKLSLRTGVQFDQTPVPSSRYRNAATPDNNRTMLALGASYRMDPRSSLDLAYAYMHVEDGKADYHDSCRVSYLFGSDPGANNCTSSGGIFRARYRDVHAHILGVQLNKAF